MSSRRKLHRTDNPKPPLLARFDKGCHTTLQVLQDMSVAKKANKKYGLLPPKIAEYEPWTSVCVDLIGPYNLQAKDGTRHVLSALTMIDPATGWFEVKAITDKTAATIMDHFNNE